MRGALLSGAPFSPRKTDTWLAPLAAAVFVDGGKHGTKTGRRSRGATNVLALPTGEAIARPQRLTEGVHILQASAS